MSTWRPNNDDDDDSDEEETVFDIKGHEAYIFVLDSQLFEKTERCDLAFTLLQDALISALMIKNKDLIGLVFANTLKSPLPKDTEGVKNVVVPANCAVFLPLRQLSKEIVEHFLEFKEEQYADFKTEYGICQGSFANMLRLCGNMFQQCGQTLSNQTIVYITDRETPVQVGSEEFQRVIQKASDMDGQNIDFTVVPMIDEFSYEPFYKEFLSLVKSIDIESFESPDPQLIREMVADRKLMLNVNKRCLGHVNWNLGNDLELSVKFYNFFQKSSYPQKVYLRRSDNSVVTAKITNYVDDKDPQTGDISHREARAGDEVYTLSCGGETIQVEESEMTKICYPYQPILQLMGFKDSTSIDRGDYLRPCSFIYPDESRIVGSTKLFTALWMKCREKKKVAICVFIPRKKAKPAFVALMPVGTKDPDKPRTYMDGDGFKVIYLPFADDWHHFDHQYRGELDDLTPEVEDLTKNIIRKLRVKYIPSRIKDPALEAIQTQLLRLAFNINCPDEDMKIPPSTTRIDDRIKHLADDVKQVFGTDAVAPKRKPSESGGSGNNSKVMKLSGETLSTSEIDNLIATNGLEKLNKAQIINFLKENDVKASQSMTKVVLIEKVLELRQSQQSEESEHSKGSGQSKESTGQPD